MTDSSGPFASPGGAWSEGEWADFAPTWAPYGVIGNPTGVPTSGPLPFASSGLSVSAGVGRAWIRGAGFKRSGTVPTHAVTANGHASWSRRDRLVLRRNLTSHLVETAVIAGTPAATPVAPALTQVDAGIWEERLFSFLVPPNNGTTITGVEDERSWLTDAPIAGKMWRTSGGQALTTSLAKVGMDVARISAGVSFSSATDDLTVLCDGVYETVQGGYVSGSSGYSGYFACRRTRTGVPDVEWGSPRYDKPDVFDRSTNATHEVPLKAGDRLSLVAVSTAATSGSNGAFGSNELACFLNVRYLRPLNGADPI